VRVFDHGGRTQSVVQTGVGRWHATSKRERTWQGPRFPGKERCSLVAEGSRAQLNVWERYA
jgi:hypothetical protein